MDILIYLGVLIAVGLIGFLGVKFAKKYNITKDDLAFSALLIELIDYISSKFEYKYKAGVSKIISLVLQAINFVVLIDDIKDGDLQRFKELVFEKSRELCIAEGIDIDDGIEDILDSIITYIIDKYIVVVEEEVK